MLFFAQPRGVPTRNKVDDLRNHSLPVGRFMSSRPSSLPEAFSTVHHSKLIQIKAKEPVCLWLLSVLKLSANRFGVAAVPTLFRKLSTNSQFRQLWMLIFQVLIILQELLPLSTATRLGVRKKTEAEIAKAVC